MELFIYFVLTFLITYLLSYFTIIRKAFSKKKKKVKKEKRKKKKSIIFADTENKIPIEVEYLIKRYKIDITKLNYKRFLHVISLVASLDMAIAVIIITPIKNIYLQILVGFIVLIPLIIVSYKLVGRFYIKKGMIKDEYKRDRK